MLCFVQVYLEVEMKYVSTRLLLFLVWLNHLISLDDPWLKRWDPFIHSFIQWTAH